MPVWSCVPLRKCNRVLLIFVAFGMMWWQYDSIQRWSKAEQIERFLNDFTEKNRRLVQDVGIFTRRLNDASHNWGEMKAGIKELLNTQRAKALIVWGIGESGNETEKWIVGILRHVFGVKMQNVDIETFRRVSGPKHFLIPRPLLMQFSRTIVKNQVKEAILSKPGHPVFTDDKDLEQYQSTDKTCTMTIKKAGASKKIASMETQFGAWIMHSSYVDNINYDAIFNTSIIQRELDPRVWLAKRDFGNKYLQEYKSLEDLKDEKLAENYSLPYSWYGTGHVIISNCLFYIRSRTNFIVKYDLYKRSMVRYRQLRNARFGEPGSKEEGCQYESGHHSDITLQADEFGLWATYCSNKDGGGSMKLARVDTDSLKVIKEWDTGWRKDFFEAMFVACGVAYAIRKFERPPFLQIKYAYNTVSSQAAKPPEELGSAIRINKSYGRISQLTYDRIGKQLLVWTRKGNLLTLPIVYDYLSYEVDT